MMLHPPSVSCGWGPCRLDVPAEPRTVFVGKPRRQGLPPPASKEDLFGDGPRIDAGGEEAKAAGGASLTLRAPGAGGLERKHVSTGGSSPGEFPRTGRGPGDWRRAAWAEPLACCRCQSSSKAWRCLAAGFLSSEARASRRWKAIGGTPVWMTGG